jgi:hypothetical protein
VTTNNVQCTFCDCVFPDDAEACLACGEPNPIWEKREALRLLEENMGDEAAWTGVPSSL